MLEQHPDVDHSVLKRNRLKSLSVLSDKLQHATVGSSLRCTHEPRVRDGRATLADLYQSAIHVNSVPIEKTDVAEQYRKMTARNKNAYFPVKEICALTGITVKDYQEHVDPHYARRDAFCQIKMLMEKARDDNLGVVAHPLLIEELVTTLNTLSIGFFPFSTVIMCGHPRSELVDIYQRNPVQPRQGIHIKCYEEKSISVYSYNYPLDWVDGLVAAHIRYDISVADDGSSIRYENVRTLLAFPGGAAKDIEDGLHGELAEFGFPHGERSPWDSVRFANALREAPTTYPEETFFLAVDTPDESIAASNMYSAPLQHASSTHSLLSDVDDIEDVEDIEDYVGRSTGIRRFFKRLANGIVSVLKFMAYPFQKALSAVVSGVTWIFEALKRMSRSSDRASYDSEAPYTEYRSPLDSIPPTNSSHIRSCHQEPEVTSDIAGTVNDPANSDVPSSQTDSVDITATTSLSQQK